MIPPDALCELASLEAADHSALSFYFQPTPPRNRSHRDEAILIRDVVRSAQREAGRGRAARAGRGDLERIAALADGLDGNHSRGKAIFACEARGFWREYDLPPRLGRTALSVNRRFHLRPLAALLAEPRCCVALTDRKHARLFDVWMDEARQIDAVTDEIPRAGRSDGFAGYAAGHAERHLGNFAMRHYQNVGERLLKRYAGGSGYDRLLIACRDELRSEIEPHLHAYLREILLGYCTLDVAAATLDEVREQVARLLGPALVADRRRLVREVLGEARRNGRGALGLRHVLTAIERGEVQTVLLSDHLEATVAECANCGHLDTRVVRDCAVCGRPTREIDDVADALIGNALRNRAGVVYVTGDAEFEQAGAVGALLRFRADQNTEMKKEAS